MSYVYSFNFVDFEDGTITATRYPVGAAVGGDWVCVADDDAGAEKLARVAAVEEWAAPESREPHDLRIEFVVAP